MATSTSTSTSQVQLPPWHSNAWYDLYTQATDLAETPYAGYNQPRIQGFNADQEAAFTAMRNNMGIASPFFQQGLTSIQNNMGTAAGMINPALAQANAGIGQALNTANNSMAQGQALMTQALAGPTQAGLQQFMNPYDSMVTDQVLSELTRQSDIAGLGEAAQAAKVGAFGGSRTGVVEAERARNLMRTQADVLSQRNAANFQQATQQFNTQQGLNMQGAGLASQMGLNTAGLGLNAANMQGQLGLQGAGALSGINLQNAMGLGQLATGMQGANSNAAQQLLSGGTLQQGLGQAALDTAYQDWVGQQQYPYQQLGFVHNILQGVPSQTTQTTSSTQPAPSTAQQWLGLGIAGAGVAGKAFGWF